MESKSHPQTYVYMHTHCQRPMPTLEMPVYNKLKRATMKWPEASTSFSGILRADYCCPVLL